MNAVRKLSIVDCPMPETAIKPVVYGAAPWSRLPHTPPAHEISIRARAQSLLSRGGHRAELPDYETAKRILAAANKPRRVTVPEPLPQREPVRVAPIGALLHPAPAGVTGAGIHSHTLADVPAKESRPPQPAPDDEAGWADYIRRAFAGEFEPF